MFEDSEVAKQVLTLFLGINGQMNHCIESLENRISPEEQKSFKRSVGYIMYEVFDKIVEPICKRHPSLKPPEMD